jgi:hypothetical protein
LFIGSALGVFEDDIVVGKVVEERDEKDSGDDDKKKQSQPELVRHDNLLSGRYSC